MYEITINSINYYCEKIEINKTGISFENPYQLMEIRKNVLETPLVSNYKIQVNDVFEATIENGYWIKFLNDDDLKSKKYSFLNFTKEESENLIKNAELELYRNLIPDLIKNQNKLKEKIEKMNLKNDVSNVDFEDDEDDDEEYIKQNNKAKKSNNLLIL